MSALVTAIADFSKDFLLWRRVACSRPSSSPPKFLWFRRLCIAACVFGTFFYSSKKKESKLKGELKLLNNNKKGG